MQDPIGSFLRIRDLYLSYLDTAFRIHDESVADERRRLLTTPGTLCTEPLVEPLPKYAPAPFDLHELVEAEGPGAELLPDFDTEERRAFVELVLAGLFDSRPRAEGEDVPTERVGRFAPYAHQVSMLGRGTRAGSPGIVTSGTGSGKTEAFLLPMLASLAKEAKGWPEPEEGFLRRRWWHDPATGRPYTKPDRRGRPKVRYEAIPTRLRPTTDNPRRSPFRPLREGERRDAAVRALVLYPMNALVEDQMVRLRKALDSREAREVMDREFDRNRIFFGRYTGKTPVTGHEDHPGFRGILDADKDDAELDRVVSGTGTEEDGGLSLRQVRASEQARRRRRQKDLFERMVALEEDQRSARYHAGGTETDLSRAPSSFGDEAPFMFPSVDGGEMVSRWDMQAYPPDVLITNVSMLSAMLTREVDEPIFSKTREWLEKPDSYFYLILDELHLQRGSAGTEVAYLLRLLLDRLGLTREEHRHKLRILASSASLPAESEEEARASTEYLWDMFGRFGLPASATSEEGGKDRWRKSIVPGEEVRSAREAAGHSSLDSRPYRDLLEYAIGGRGNDGVRAETASAPDPTGNHEVERLWRAVARDLGVDDVPDAKVLVERCVEEASARLVAACWNAEEERTRATTVRRIGWFLFEDLRRLGGKPADIPFDAALEAVRALLFVRGSGDGLHDFLRGDASAARSFRMHTFFRSIEGLYAPAWKEAGAGSTEEISTRGVEVGRLSVEREGRKDYDMPEGGRQSLRQFELLYCECCGELFFGGMRSRGSGGTDFLTELLPHEPQLDGLPDAAASQRFEELSFEQYALFWPTGAHDTRVRGETGNRDHGSWRRAFLERETGVVSKPPDGRRGGGAPGGNVLRGFVYERSNSLDKHGRGRRSAETHVPYACPKCGTDYYRRSLGMGRLSPVRNFRAGFAKTTQLLATELFDAQRVANPEGAKLIAFSDSRQDAARAALDIESNHHQDLRRELLIGNLRRFVASKRDAGAVESELSEIQRAISAAAAREDFDEVQEAMPRRAELQKELRACLEPSVALSSVVEHPDDWDAFGPGKRVSWLIADMVRRGVHPYDDAGVDRPAGLNEQNKTRRFDWDDLFEIRDGEVFWRGDSTSDATRHTARRQLVRAFHRTMTDVVFSRTYFSPEESGLGYVTVSSEDLQEDHRTADRVSRLSALLRVITDSYRYEPNPYHREDNEVAPWTVYGDVGTRRVKDFARAAWGDAAETRLMEAIEDLGQAGHGGGIVRLPAVRIRLAEAEDPYWRCRVCSRVHLHRGAGVCTRCYTALPEEAEGRVEELRGGNFLARKVVRGMAPETANGHGDAAFRLHCEELTGQTEDPALRQRKFRGIFVPRVEELAIRDGEADSDGESSGVSDGDGSSSEDRVIDTRLRVSDRAFEAKETIDLLTVTTTMEVGIDVGPLQTVLQSNMPPQRFNYQQRVGRAGRRGQAFSMALTICRTRSHDIYYFHEPAKITGDVPPTPFLTRRMTDIAERFVRKRWLVDAFSRLREEDRSDPLGLYHGDLMSPPDIHGEFLPTKTYLDDERAGWPARLRAALEATRPTAEAFRDLLEADGNLERPLVVDADSLLQEMDDSLESGIAHGLANSLAELGLLPMYGMPTRVRDLYLGLGIEDNRPVARSIDRDLDVAIYEFAPGATVVKDKHEHRCVGITPSLGLPEYVPNHEDADAIGFQNSPFGEMFRMVQCPVCSAWARLDGTEGVEEIRCEACGAFVSVDAGRDCAVPNAFRTDFGPVSKDEPSSGTRHRSVQAEGKFLELRPCELEADVGFRARTRVAFDPRARTYRLNRGPLVEGEPMGFEFSRGSQRVRLGRGHIRLPDQAMVDGLDLRGFEPSGADDPLWLAAPKTTDSLYIASSTVHDALSLHRLPARSPDPDHYAVSRWQGVRAAALSATFLVADRAAAELDIDPSELEVLEPRPYGVEPRLPLLQITDELVNGAGFCRNLSESEHGAPKIVRILLSMLSNREEYPLDRLLAEDHGDCDTACYRCLLRYRNQPYHGLLDWRLGLSYIRAMLDPGFSCGLDGEFAHLGLERWQSTAGRVAEEMVRRFGGESRTFADGMVWAFRLDSRGGVVPRWVLIAHPLWDWDGSEKPLPDTILARAEEEASQDGPVDCWDTFNLMRRPVQVREWIREGSR